MLPRGGGGHTGTYHFNGILRDHGHLKEGVPEADVERNVYTYLHALQRISNHRSTDEREVALRFANELWNEWQVLEKDLPKYGKSARMIERVYAAMIKVNAM